MTEERLAHLRREIEAAEAELFEREAELVDLRVELSAFRLEYDTRVGRKVEELEEIEKKIARCRERIRQYRQWGPAGLPKTRSGEAYVSVEEQYRRTWQEPAPPEPPPFPARVDAATQAQIKKLYRQLCRRFHPDLTQDETERAWRTEVMAEINAAYAARSLTELQALARRPDRRSSAEVGLGAGTGTSRQVRLDALRDRLRLVRRRLQEVEQAIYELTNGPSMQMSIEVKLARRYGRDLLAEMEADVEKDLPRKRAELEFLVAQLKQLGRP